MKKFPCFECIKVNNGGCCTIHPIATLEEAAKIAYKHMNVINERNIAVNRVNDAYQFTWKNKKLCPFLDLNKGCLIYEDRPKICRDFGETIGVCPYSGEETVKEKREQIQIPFKDAFKYVSTHLISTKKPIKELDIKKTVRMLKNKEIWHLAIVANQLSIFRDKENPYFENEYEYNFVVGKEGAKPAQINKFKPKHIELNALSKVYNFIYRKISIMDYDAAEMWADKINKAIAQVPEFNLIDNKELETLLFAVLYLRKFKTTFKGKKEEFKGIVNTDEIRMAEKFIFKECGIDEEGLMAYSNEIVVKMMKFVDMIYRIIQNLK